MSRGNDIRFVRRRHFRGNGFLNAEQGFTLARFSTLFPLISPNIQIPLFLYRFRWIASRRRVLDLSNIEEHEFVAPFPEDES